MEEVGNKYLEIKGDSIIFTGEYGEMYLDEKIIEGAGLIQEGKSYKAMGIANFRVFDAEASARCISGTLMFNFPSVFYTEPTAVVSQTVEIMENVGPRKYTILKYYKGDKVFVNRSIVKLLDYTEIFFKIFNNGKIPSTIPYTHILDMMMQNMEINSQSLGTPPMILSLMIADSCRYKDDRSLPFRVAYNNNKSVYDFIATGFREISKNSSTFSAITFEDFDSMVDASIVRNGETHPSPIEKLLWM